MYSNAVGAEIKQDMDFTKHLKEVSNVTLEHAERMLVKLTHS